MPAFSPIDPEAHARHVELVAASDLAVLCDVPIGTNNLPNLDALAVAQHLICMETTPPSERDFTGGAAQKLFEKLPSMAHCRTVDEALALIREEASLMANARVQPSSQAPGRLGRTAPRGG